MKCTCCGLEMKQLFTSWYCPSCEGGNTSDVKETPDPSSKPNWNWTLCGPINKVERHILGYKVEFGTNMPIITSIILKNNDIILGCQFADFLVGFHHDRYTLHYRRLDNKYCIAQPGWYWENSQWKYSAYHHFHHQNTRTP